MRDQIIVNKNKDPEGFTFDSLTNLEVERGAKIVDDQYRKAVTRALELGYVIQPLIVDRMNAATMGEHLDELAVVKHRITPEGRCICGDDAE